jgi:hypothetical protein
MRNEIRSFLTRESRIENERDSFFGERLRNIGLQFADVFAPPVDIWWPRCARTI